MIVSELRRCPFCGNEAEIVPCDPPEWFSGAKHVKIRCSNEYCMMHDHGMIRLTASVEEYCNTLQSACSEWNTRKIWDAKKKRIQDIYDDGGTYDDLEALREIVKIVMDIRKGGYINMKKIPTLFERVFDGHKIIDVLPNITQGCEDALLHGVPTVKIDGTCCAIINGTLYKRYDAKIGRKVPEGAIPCQDDADPITGHWPHWLKVSRDKPEDKWLFIAHFRRLKPFDHDCTAEVYGKHFNGNPYGMDHDEIEEHGKRVITDLDGRDFASIKQWLTDHNEEGIVFWLDGKPVCKIKRSDFGLPWGGKKR